MFIILIMRSYRQGELLERPPKDGFLEHPEVLFIEIYIVLIRGELLYCAVVGSISSIGVIYKCKVWFLY